MNIGIFDSGLGGLFVMRSIVKKLPQYNCVYLGDTKRVPYGNRSHETILEFTKEALEFLFSRECSLVILACNSASAQALREIQQSWLPQRHPDKKVLGVIIPTVEHALTHSPTRIGILATQSTVRSHTYVKEIKKRNKRIRVFQQPASLLVPIVESEELSQSTPMLQSYLAPLERKKIDTLLLACTHYGILKNRIQRLTKKKMRIVSQNDVVPQKLLDYLKRHSEIERTLQKRGKLTFFATDITPTLTKQASSWFRTHIHIRQANL